MQQGLPRGVFLCFNLDSCTNSKAQINRCIPTSYLFECFKAKLLKICTQLSLLCDKACFPATVQTIYLDITSLAKNIKKIVISHSNNYLDILGWVR
uniref:Uncharacterized protein n=1 Tax=Arundo donax TaxID=35708 RepID=A0A0A9BZG1_ARUDO